VANDGAKNRLVEKMFEALLKQRISQCLKKYGQQSVTNYWGERVNGGGIKAFLSEREWNAQTKLIDALDYLDDYCDLVESMIRATKKGKRGKNDSTMRN